MSIVRLVVTVTKVPISVLTVRIWDPVNCLAGDVGLPSVSTKVAGRGSWKFHNRPCRIRFPFVGRTYSVECSPFGLLPLLRSILDFRLRLPGVVIRLPGVVVRGCGRVDLSRVQSKTRGEPRPDDKNSSSFGARLGANTLPLRIYNPQRRFPLAKVHRLQRSDAPLIGSFRIGTTFSNARRHACRLLYPSESSELGCLAELPLAGAKLSG